MAEPSLRAYFCLSVVLILLVLPTALAQQQAVQPSSINQVMREDDFSTHILQITNNRRSVVIVDLSFEGGVADLASVPSDTLVVPLGATEDLSVNLFGRDVGEFNGTLELAGGLRESVPITLTVLSRDFLPVDALLIEIIPESQDIHSGGNFYYRVELHNLLSDKQYNVTLNYALRPYDSDDDEIIQREIQKLRINTSLTMHRELPIAPDFPEGAFILEINASFLNQTAGHAASFSVSRPFLQKLIFGIELWKYLAVLAALLLGYLLFRWYKRYKESKKRYHIKLDIKTLPKPGPRTAFIGKVAERKEKAYYEIDKLTTHCIVAGATGRGKSVVAQVIIEEALMQGVGVIVFDPTAQWSGMLRKCDDKRMLSLYPRFEMKKSAARGFPGNVRQIKHAREVIDIPSYIKPGEVQIFSMNTLEPAEIDLFVANSVRTVFKANFDEYPELRLLLVYDEVHRLLPRFGGSGEGFVQIERACREFRKWGIGVMLVSQVLQDFVGEIKANINTEIQLRTGDEGDLNRISTKYGESVLRSLVKAPVGTCMFENPAYNRGAPYFIAVRPILHATRRLLDDELELYNKYNDITDDLDYQIEQLEELKVDVFDLKLELKLAVDKIKSGNFNMVEIYLEGLTPRIEEHWKKLRKTPKKREMKLVGEEELKADLEAAKKEREKLAADEEAKEATKVEKVLKFEKRAAGNASLTLNSGAIISSLNELRDAMETFPPEVWAQHVKGDKNEIADWISAKLGMLDVAERFQGLKNPKEAFDYLNEMEKKKEMIELNPEKPPKEDNLAEMNGLILQLIKLLRAGKQAEAGEVHKKINALYLKLPKEAKVAIYKKLNQLKPFMKKGGRT